MSIDPYSPCPCGSGKKLKFCCADLAGELEKISRMLEGDQPSACLEHIRGLLKKDPDRASLLGLQAMLENELEQFDLARATVDHLLKAHPENVNGLAERAIVLANSEGGAAAVDCLQSAMERLDQYIPLRFHSALLVASQVLLEEGRLLAARAHLLAAASVSPQEDRSATELLFGLYREPGVPLPFKVEWPLVEADPQLSSTAQWGLAIAAAHKAEWRRAAAALETVAQNAPKSPAVWWNLGLCRAWLADDARAVEAFGNCTEASATSDLDMAVEAAMLAQLLSPTPAEDLIDAVQMTYPVHDVAALESALDRHTRAERVEYDRAPGDENAGPPPHGAFRILDRPLPPKGSEFTLEQAPVVLGVVLIYGKQTDRPARLEFVANRGEDVDRIASLLGEVDGEAIDTAQSTEEVLGKVSRSQSALAWRMRLPDGISGQRRRALLLEQRKQTVLGRWPKIAQPLLGGKSPAEAAQGDAVAQASVLAAILVLRETIAAQWLELDFDDLRRQLGLPPAEPIDPAGRDWTRFPMFRADRLIVDKIAQHELDVLYGRSCLVGASRAAWKLGNEIVRRPESAAEADLPEVHGLLASLEWDAGRALDHLEAARQADLEAGKSCARWDLAELSMRLENGEIPQCRDLVVHIQAKHGREPGVVQGLYQILAAYGALGPAPPGPAGGAAPQPVAAPQAAGEIWTPGGGQAAEAGGKKSDLWLPGMD